MTNFIATLQYYFSYPFVQYALIVGVLIALCSSLLGVTLVLKRFSFIGDGLSHVAFGAMAVATVLQFTSQTLFIMIVTVIAAIFLLRTGQNTKIKGDSAIAMLSVGALAIGYLVMNIFSTSANVSGDVCSTLFGSTTILTLTHFEVVVCIVMSLLVVLFYVLMNSFKGVVIYSAILSVIGAFVGIILSILFSTPVGATVVFINIMIFIINWIISIFK